MNFKNRKLAETVIVALSLLGQILIGSFASAASLEPIFVKGNASCPAWTQELKVEPVADGTYTDGVLTITVNVSETDAPG